MNARRIALAESLQRWESDLAADHDDLGHLRECPNCHKATTLCTMRHGKLEPTTCLTCLTPCKGCGKINEIKQDADSEYCIHCKR